MSDVPRQLSVHDADYDPYIGERLVVTLYGVDQHGRAEAYDLDLETVTRAKLEADGRMIIEGTVYATDDRGNTNLDANQDPHLIDPHVATEMCPLGRVDGKDGDPGLGFDDMSIAQNGERGITLRFARGEQVKSFDLTMPVIIDRGVFKQGQFYETGDAVTFGGSLWIAQKGTEEKPNGPEPGWRLAMNKPRDGRDLTGD